ncbi:MAG: D-alanyl-D-alanine carboxypeptidase [Firmicutes bacterium]|nr:D-alanyl-D-alanine carboxypeptidase [Bacillota bacterium]
MRKILYIAGCILAFILGVMIWFYFAEPTGKAVSEDLPAAPEVSARQAILIDGKSGETLFEKAAEERAYPASTTKIMTALMALELCRRYDIGIDTEVTVPKEAVGVEGSSVYLKAGESRTIEELLYGAMLRSGNDAATALAVCLGGNEKNFVKMMNDKARELGCHRTQFVNPTGLFDEAHYTTAKDLACIARMAMEIDTFRQIATAKTWGTYTNKNKTVFQYEGGTGIKIGFTEKSGRTLVASARRGDTELIAVVLDDGNWFADAYALMDYGFMIKGVEKDE